MVKSRFLLALIFVIGFGKNVLSQPSQNEFLNAGKLIENKGQIADADGKLHPEVLFKTQKGNATLFFKKSGVVFLFNKFEIEQTPESRRERELGNFTRARVLETKPFIYRMDLNFIDANPDVDIISSEKTFDVTNYYTSQHPNGITGVRSYKNITYKDIYPNIDLVYYFTENGLKYDFIVKPGGHISDIKLNYDGANDIEISKDGSLKVLYADNRQLIEKTPIAFFQNGKKIKVKFNIDNSSNIISFFSKKDILKETLIIDPAITWATYFYNASSSETTINNYTAPKFDANGNFFYAAQTYDNAFPTVDPGGGVWFDGSSSTMIKVVVMKFTSDRALVWSTYYGGDQYDCLAGCTDYGKALAVDNNGNVYVAGYTTTNTTVFPTYNPGGGAFYQDQSKCYGETSFFLKFDNNGIRLWATMFQHENSNTNSSGMRINSICTDGTNLFFSGQTYRSNSNDIPLRNPGGGAYYQSTFVGGMDAFVGRFSSSCVLNWATYINSGNTSNQAYAAGLDVTCDENGNFYMVGRETGNTGPVVHHLIVNPGGGAFMQSTPNGSQNIQISKFSSSLAAVWSTYYGGEDMDIPSTIEPDGFGHIFIVGRRTESATFPTYDPGGGAYCLTTKPTAAGTPDGFGLKFDESTCARMWASFLGGSGSSVESHFPGLGFDSYGNVYMSGYTNSPNMTTLNQTGSYNQSSLAGDYDMFYYEFNSSMQMQWGTYYGGSGYDRAYNGRLGYYDAPCGVKILSMIGTGNTALSTVDPGGGAWYQNNGGAINNDFLIEFSDASAPLPVSVSITASATTICPGDNVTFTATPTNGGSSPVYQWYLNGSSVGTNSSTYSNASLSNNDQVYCVLTSSEGCVSGNPATSNTATINVNTESTAPSSITASANPVCPGNSTTLSVNGGSLGTGATWEWYTGSCGGTSIGSGSSITVSPATTTNYYVRAEGTCNTTTCANITITVNSSSTAPASITATANPICSGSSTTLSVNGGSLGTGASWEWYSGGCGSTSVGSGSSITVSPATTTTYYVRAEGTCNTTTCASVTITVNSESVAPTSVTASINPVCTGGSTDLSISGGSLGTSASWVWYEGGCGTGASIGTGNTLTVNPTNSTTYYVRAEGTCNTTGCASVAITVTPGANAGTDGTITTCQNSSSFDMFTILGGSPDAGGIWTDNVGNTVSSTFDPSTQTSGVFTYTVTGSGSCGDDSATVTVTVNPLPTVSFTGLDSSYCGSGGDYIVLTGNHAPNGSFSGTDVTDNSNGTANFLPQNTGTYTITYTYTDGNGCTANDVQTTTILPAPSVQFVGLDTGYCYGSSSVNLIGNQAPSGSFTGVGITDNMDGSAIFTPDSVGQFSVIYSYTDGNGCTGIDVQQVSVYDNPVFGNITVTDVTVCAPPYDGEITITGTGGNGNYLFSFDGGSYTTDTVFDTLTIGNYPITIMDDYGCTSDTSVAVGGNTGFNISQVYTQNLQCFGDSSGGIIISATDGTQYSIDNGTSFQNDSTFTNLTGGIYYIQVTNNSGCTALDTVILNEPVQLAYDYEQDSVSCYGYSNGSITLNVTGGTPAYNYSWSPSGYTQNNGTYSGLPEGSYAVTVTDTNGCSFSIPKIEIRQPNAIVVQSTTSDASCYGTLNGTATIVTTGGTQPYTYAWTGGYTGSQENNLPAGTYFITVTDNNNCQEVDTVIIGSPSAIEISEVITPPSCMGNNDGSVSVAATGGQSPYIYLWNNGDIDSLAGNLIAGTYYLTLTDNNGCEAMNTYNLPDGTETCLNIPNVFTPNGDGSNDTWIIEGIDLYPDVTVEIYNRWGDLIFKSNGYQKPWDGTWHGKELPISSFIYIIDLNNGSDPVQGIVTIKR